MRDKLTERFDRMMKVLFRQEGANLEIGILASEEAQDFIEAHSSVLNGSFRKVEMSETMRKRLERSNYVFSGLKTFHELNEAFPSLLDENGNRKTFERFLNVLKGTVKIHIGKKVYTAKKGESFYFTPHSEHYIEAPNSTGATIIWVSTPPSF